MEKTTRRLPIVERDEWLQPVEAQMNLRHERYERKMADIGRSAGSLVDYANGYRYFGWQWDDVLDGWWLREWLPGAHDVYVFGDFNNWQRTEIRMHKDAAGVWSVFFPAAMYRDRLRHGSLYKIHVHGDNGWLDRIPAHARRQWSLAKNGFLRYAWLGDFDRAMIRLVKKYKVLADGYPWNLLMDERNKTMAFSHGDLLFVFNWHPSASIPDYELPVQAPGKYVPVLSTDESRFGGQERQSMAAEHFSFDAGEGDGQRQPHIRIYNTSRTATVYLRKK